MSKKISLYRIRKGLVYLRHYGIREFWIHLKERFQNTDVDYATWYQEHKVSEAELEEQRKERFSYQPLLSILVPAYHTPEEYLKQMIESLMTQTYANWELCIANASPKDQKMAEILSDYGRKDGRIRVVEVWENQGIAQNTNAALRISKGEYVGFLDHDDLLTPNALYEVVKKINENKEYEVIYTDEDKISEDLTEQFQPHLKPEFNLDLLRSNNYICHFCVIKKSLIEKVGSLNGDYNGAQDYDLIFRCVEKAVKITRIPKILYHWRIHRESTADNPMSKKYAFENGKRAIEAHLLRCGEEAVVSSTKDMGFYRVTYQVKGNPKISIIIPNKDHIEELDRCLRSIQKSTYANYEVIIVENNSEKEETFSYYKKIASEQIRVVVWESAFNYSAINNYGVTCADGDYFLFLNNDVEIIGADWMEELLANCQRREVGVCGAKLYYPDHTVQHAGVIVGIGGVAGNLFTGLPEGYSGYMHKASIQQNMSAVTAACMMVKRIVFEEVAGFTEALAVAFNDVDFCLKVREKGYLIVYNPYVELYHLESKTRGAEDTKEKWIRFQSEIDYMKETWADILKNGDPMYHPEFSLKRWDYSLR